MVRKCGQSPFLRSVFKARKYIPGSLNPHQSVRSKKQDRVQLAPIHHAQTNAAFPQDFTSLTHQVQRGRKTGYDI
jgi:hypothetical protein